ncbi:phosphate binding protein [Desulfovibrio sp. X2]|uniref:phosphate ABC transporter substrate-binding protein n=1 Tax=Desulfovibrio sp. X2 TaxID=941449 RepID=UPI000358914C|nr:phosphate ABC transporter substrate-binding protein [Desulfovibrio sp. X2]EPR43856.1 phosphate binding protein [Desulfovibrio sp. X2]
MKAKLLALAAVLTLALTGSAWAGSLTIKGSTTVLPIMQRAVEAYMKAHPDMKIDLSAGGSGEGIKALIDGTTDIAMASREMKDKEIELAKSKGEDPKMIIIARDAVCAIVNPNNPVQNLTVDQLQGIFSGKITDWKDVGGNPGRIAVISRDSSSGTFETWQEHVLKKEKVSPMALMQASSGAVMESVSKNKYAIAYDGLGYVTKDVKALKVNGVTPSEATARDGSYPVSRSLQIYVNGEPKGELKGFVDYLLSPAGQKDVKEAGYVTVK